MEEEILLNWRYHSVNACSSSTLPTLGIGGS